MKTKWTKNQLSVIKEYFNLNKYMRYCFDLGYNPSDAKNKIEYGNMLIGIYKYKVEHGYIER